MNFEHRVRTLRGPLLRGASFTLAALLAAALPAACGSSGGNNGKSTIGKNDGTGATSGGDGSAGPSAGGGGTFFGDGGDFITDAQPPPISPDAACGESTVQASAKQVNILLVIDESGSMGDKPTGFSTDKWTALKSAVGSTLAAVENDIAFGLELFPFPTNPKTPISSGCTGMDCCQMASAGINIPIDKGTIVVPKITAALDAAGPGGATPTALALKNAHDYFVTGAGSKLAGDRYVLLATDGGPNCDAGLTCDATTCTSNIDGNCPSALGNCCDPTIQGPTQCLDDAATKQQIDALAKAGVKTFVVGIPGAEPYQKSLDAFAVAGGETNPKAPPSYFAVSASGGTTGLADVLGSITKTLVTTCQLALTSPPQDINKLNVLVDGARIPKGADGWDLDTSTSPPTIDLLGSTCDKVQTEGAQKVQVLYGCKTITR